MKEDVDVGPEIHSNSIYEPKYDKTSKITCAQRRLRSTCAPCSLIRVFAFRLEKSGTLAINSALRAKTRISLCGCLNFKEHKSPFSENDLPHKKGNISIVRLVILQMHTKQSSWASSLL